MNSKHYRSFVLISFFFVLLVFASSSCRCQDKIYLENEEIYGKVIEITPEKIKYKRLDNFDGPMYSITRKRVKLLFNKTGSFLIMQKLDSMDTGQATKLINNFINLPSQNASNLDKLFTFQNKQIDCTILSDDSLLYTINYNDLDIKYDKALVAVIIYKDGKHKIVSDLNTAIGVLSSLQFEINPETGISKVKKTSVTNINSNQELSNQPVTKVPETDKADGVVKSPIKNEINKEEKLQEDSLAKLNNEKKYNQAIGNAQAFYRRGEYEYAKTAYSLALALKPDEQEPKEKIDSINNILINDKKYKQAIADAEAFYKKEEYENAKAAYLKAAALKPDEQELKVKIDSINNILIYNSLADSSGSLIARGEYDTALIICNKILELRPSDYYATKQINYLKEAIVKKEVEDEIRKKKELEERYRNAIIKGDALKKAGDFKGALDAYNEAAGIHPESEDLKQNIRIVTYQLKVKASNNKPN